MFCYGINLYPYFMAGVYVCLDLHRTPCVHGSCHYHTDYVDGNLTKYHYCKCQDEWYGVSCDSNTPQRKYSSKRNIEDLLCFENVGLD